MRDAFGRKRAREIVGSSLMEQTTSACYRAPRQEPGAVGELGSITSDVDMKFPEKGIRTGESPERRP